MLHRPVEPAGHIRHDPDFTGAIQQFRNPRRLGNTTRRIHAQIIFLDPPYAADAEYERVLETLGESLIVAPEARVIVEHLCKREMPERVGDLELARVVE